MNYKVKVGSEAESKEAQGLLFKLGYKWFSGGNQVQHLKQSCSSSFGYLVAWSTGCFTNVIQCGCGNEVAKELTIPQLKDLVVLKRNDVGDATHGNLCGQKGYLTCENVEYFWNYFDKKWNKISLTFIGRGLKPITKEPVMKEYLDPENNYKFIVTDKPFFDWIEVPEGADTLAGDSSTRYFWKHGVGEKGNMIIGVGESLTRYSGWTDCEDSADVRLGCVNDDSFKIIWQRETLNDKVASAEVARQEFIGVPFSDLPEFKFEAADVVDVVDESNVEQTLNQRQEQYGSFEDVATATQDLLKILEKTGLKSLPSIHKEALHMICSKMVRIVNGDHNFIESWHDIAGYATLMENELRVTDGATNSRLTYQKVINGKLQDI